MRAIPLLMLIPMLIQILILQGGAAFGAIGALARDAAVAGEGAGYPWYDARTGRFIPIWPSTTGGDAGESGGEATASVLGILGQMIVTAVLAVILALVVGLLVAGWLKRREWVGEAREAGSEEAGRSARSLELPEALRGADWSDPWAAAVRLRESGDDSGAIVALFAYALKALGEGGWIRLEPGRTGRQLVRSIGDREVRGLVEPVLKLFEQTFYGKRRIDAETFGRTWEAAERLRSRIEHAASEDPGNKS
jgi:hypothetical protein